jgi:RimJ/RimL family protein N-acetyltransferase
MPFGVAWTDAPEPTRQREAYRFWARCRAQTSAQSWSINLAILLEGRPIGACSLMAEHFPTLRSFETGSWITQSEQGRGYGTEMRAALLELGFAGFGADEATTAAFADNPRSLGVTRRHGYEPNGTKRMLRRGEPADLLRFRLGREAWAASRRDDIELVGVDGVRDLLAIALP